MADERLDGGNFMAASKLQEGETSSADDIKAFCKDNITHFKIRRYIRFVDGYPMTVTGKTQKFIMRDQMAEELAND